MTLERCGECYFKTTRIKSEMENGKIMHVLVVVNECKVQLHIEFQFKNDLVYIKKGIFFVQHTQQ